MSSNLSRGTAGGSLTDSMNRLVGAIFGGIYLLVGLLGFTVTGFDGWVDTNTNETLLGFELNPLHNVAHLLIGGLLLAAALKGVAAAKGANTLVGAVYLVLAILGFFIAGENTGLNILSLNQADNFLHLVSAAVLLGVGLTQDKNVRGDTPGV